MDFQRIAERIEKLKNESVEFLARICSIPALGPDNGGTGEMAKYLVVKDEVLKIGPDEIIEIPAPDGRVPDGVRPNALAIFKGKDTSKTLWILSHIDVVPIGELRLWDHDPFDPHVADGYLYGRGVEDNGQALVASVFAARAVKEVGEFGINVGLALVSDEECGSLYGLDYVLNNRPDLFGPQDFIIAPDAGSKDGDVIEISEKHLFQVKFTITGKQGHASRPDKCRNSLRAAANMVVALDDALHSKFNVKDSFFNPSESTFEPTRKEANVQNINTIPGEDIFFFDCRVLPKTDLSDVIAEMRSIAKAVAAKFGVDVTVEEHLKSESPNGTPPDSPVVIALAQAVQEIYGVQARPQGIGGQTVATFFRKKGLPAAVWEKIEGWAHAPNERILIDNLIGNTKVFARMMISK
ncbi:MAG: M20 family metallo-hydrolase [Desulfomonilaceae bacterium]